MLIFPVIVLALKTALGHSQTDPILSQRCRKAPSCSSFTCTYLPYRIIWIFPNICTGQQRSGDVSLCLFKDGSTVYNLVFGYGTLVFDPV